MRSSGQHGASSGQLTMLVARMAGRWGGGHTLVPGLPPTCSGYESGGTLLFMSAVFDDEGSWGRVNSPLQSSGASVSWKRLHVCTGISDAVRVMLHG